jgi:hypothetical protein
VYKRQLQFWWMDIKEVHFQFLKQLQRGLILIFNS